MLPDAWQRALRKKHCYFKLASWVASIGWLVSVRVCVSLAQKIPWCVPSTQESIVCPFYSGTHRAPLQKRIHCVSLPQRNPLRIPSAKASSVCPFYKEMHRASLPQRNPSCVLSARGWVSNSLCKSFVMKMISLTCFYLFVSKFYLRLSLAFHGF